jgi:hypothetical protein
LKGKIEKEGEVKKRRGLKVAEEDKGAWMID